MPALLTGEAKYSAAWVLCCVLGVVLTGICGGALIYAQQPQPAPRVLVYTRNYLPGSGGYVHANIADSVAALQLIGERHGIAVDVSEDPAVFTDANLARYGALVFSNSNNEAFATQAQRDAFQRYIHAGHGFVGLHSASGSERNWPYFQQVLGGEFAFHPQEQSFIVQVTDPTFAAVQGVPATFLWTDECYFLDKLNPDIHVVLATDRTNLLLVKPEQHPGSFPNPLPLAWWHTFDNSREFYLALGHNPADYRNPLLIGMLERGLLWAMGPATGTSAAAAVTGTSGTTTGDTH